MVSLIELVDMTIETNEYYFYTWSLKNRCNIQTLRKETYAPQKYYINDQWDEKVRVIH